MSGRTEVVNAEVAIVPTGAANVASVMAAMGRVGARARIAADAAEVGNAGLVVVPGVGSFGAAMGALREGGVDAAIAERVRDGRATLGICLGMQVMFEGSDESPGVAGLGVIEGRVERFAEAAGGQQWRVPQMGWNRVEAPERAELIEAEVTASTDRSGQRSVARQDRIIQSGAAYFANSYRVAGVPEGWKSAMAEHGGRFVAGMERGAVVLCQFHPELSGAWGLGLIRRWIAAGIGARC